MNNRRQQARANYDRLSRWYDWIAASENPYKDRGLRLLHLCPGEQFLEIGFGTGRTFAMAADQLGETGLAVGVDLSPGMAAVAYQKLPKTACMVHTLLTVGDAVVLPYARNSFDALYLAFTLELFDTPEIPLVLSECQRVLRKHGRMAVVTLSQPEKPNLPVRVYGWFHHHFPDAIDCRPIQAARIIAQNGFAIQKQEQPKMWGLPLIILLCAKVS